MPSGLTTLSDRSLPAAAPVTYTDGTVAAQQGNLAFGGLPLRPPGVVPVTEWRPTPGQEPSPTADLHAGVARIPRRGRR
jgi:hypothetical protein